MGVHENNHRPSWPKSDRFKRWVTGDFNKEDEDEALAFIELNCKNRVAWGRISGDLSRHEKVKLGSIFKRYLENAKKTEAPPNKFPKDVIRELEAVLNRLKKSTEDIKKNTDWFSSFVDQIEMEGIGLNIIETETHIHKMIDKAKNNRYKNKTISIRNILIRDLYEIMEASRGNSFNINNDVCRKFILDFCLICGAIDKKINFPDENLKNILKGRI